MGRMRNRDVCAGGMFALLGLAGLWLSQNYAFGTATRMGPGFFPRSIASGLFILGILIVLRGLVAGSPAVSMNLRAIPLVLGSIVLFALLVERAGLPIATVACIVVASLASREAKVREVVLLSIALAATATALFVYALGLPIPVWFG
jgi:hypothetical protein